MTLDEARTALQQESSLDDRWGPWPPPDDVEKLVTGWLSIRTDSAASFTNTYAADKPPEQSLVDLTNLTWVPDTTYLVDDHWMPNRLRVLLAMAAGEMSPSHIAQNLARGSTVVTLLTKPEDLGDLLEYAWTNRFDSVGFPAWAGTRTSEQLLREARIRSLAGASNQFPLTQSSYGCQWMQRFRPSAWNDPLVLMVGDTAEECAFSFTRDRFSTRTLWVPLTEFWDASLGPIVRRVLAKCVRDLSRTAGQPREVIVSSFSADEAGLQAVVTALSSEAWLHNAKIGVSPVADIKAPRDHVLLDSIRFNDRLRATFVDGRLATLLELELPTSAESQDPWKCRWQVDFALPDCVLPARPQLAEVADEGDTATWSVRCALDGVSYHSHSMGFVLTGLSLRQMLARPQLRLPTAEDVFHALLGDRGSMRESSAGHYQARAVQLWGGLESLATDLSNGATRDLLRAWLASTPSGVDPGVYCDPRRFLSIEDVYDATGMDTTHARNVLDRYVVKGILRRGVILGCSRCRDVDHYPLADLGPTFQCRRCNQHGDIVQAAWRNPPEEPRWYYALDEVVYQFLRGNGDIPILALGALRAGKRSFLSMSEAEVIVGNKRLELDIWAVADGRVLIGEAKTVDELESTAAKERKRCQLMAQVAELMHADALILATSQPAWNSRSIKAMKAALPAHIELLELVNLGS